jgi:hypothetical protein
MNNMEISAAFSIDTLKPLLHMGGQWLAVVEIEG